MHYANKIFPGFHFILLQIVLQEIEIMNQGKTVFTAHGSKGYHLGFGKNVTRSNLAKVNERRDPKIFEEFAYRTMSPLRKIGRTFS